MTCKQLYGACDLLIYGETSEEMIENSKKHGMEMAAKGDEDHIKVMEAMKQNMDDPEAVKKWNEDFKAKFDSLPEDPT